MEHLVTLKGRQVHDIEGPACDLAGHIITAGSANTDTMRIKWDPSVWAGYDQYSVIFQAYHDGEVSTAKEYAIDYDNPVVTIPPSLTSKPGILRFSIKALTPENGQRLMAGDDRAFFEVVDAGEIDGSYGNEDGLTRLEEALERAKNIEDAATKADEAVARAKEAVARAESIAAFDYDALINKPRINDTTIQGDVALADIGMTRATAADIYAMFE